MRSKYLLALGGGLLIGIVGVVHADVTPSEATLREEVAALKAEMAQLKVQQNDSWLAERRAEDFKAMVRDVLSDADTRASLLENGMSAGHNGEHFFLASDDGGFRLEISGQIQMRYVMSFQDEEDAHDDDHDPFEDGFPSGNLVSADVDDETEFGFEIPRAKIQFAGHVADPRLNYAIRLAVDRETNNVSADKIVISYEWADGVTIWAGEDKAPFLREELTSPARQQAVERSYVNEIFTLDRVQGVGVNWDVSDQMKLAVMVNDGSQSGKPSTNLFTQGGSSQVPVDEDGEPEVIEDDDGNFVGFLNAEASGITKGFDGDRSDFAITARVDWMVSGAWDQMKDFAAWEGEDKAVFVGAAIHWEEGETGDAAFNNDFLTWTIDGSIETNGWNLYAAVVGQHTDLEHESDVLGTDLDLYGYVVQGGMMLANTSWEPFIRYEYIDFDDGFSDSVGNDYDDVEILTLGANYYLDGHNAKFTFDVVWAFDPLPVGQTGLGLQADNADDDDQVVLRAQFQLLF